jgi:hypothetical protein
MATSIGGWIAENLKRVDGGTRWCFEVDRSRSPVEWRWERYWDDELVERSRTGYSSFADCSRDARRCGFRDGQPYALRERTHAPSAAWAGPARDARAAFEAKRE